MGFRGLVPPAGGRCFTRYVWPAGRDWIGANKMKMIDADHLINEIEELKKSPWYNNIYGFIYQKEAIDMIVDLCIKREPEQSVYDLTFIGHRVGDLAALCELYRTKGIILDNVAEAFKQGFRAANEEFQKALKDVVMRTEEINRIDRSEEENESL